MRKSRDLNYRVCTRGQKDSRRLKYFFYFYFILLYNTVLVLPYIDMNPPRVYLRSQTYWCFKPTISSLYHLSFYLRKITFIWLNHYSQTFWLLQETCCCCCFPVAKLCLTLWPHRLQHARLPCPSLSPRVCSNSCPLSGWCHPIIPFFVFPFSSCLQSFPTSGSFLSSRLFTSDGQRIGASASASVLPKKIQGWFPLGLTGLISLLSKGLKNLL